MDGEETKSCPNCKREIPAVNFTIHSVHCARNIKICPVCKEPVPGSELDEHHQKMHKLLPCKQCGESVCGTDLEDHIRDSCANTVKSCRFCDLELPRRELPTHEGYCGVRTEQCPDCKEYVMIKYQQLHLDSNHGFIRLDDDPAPPKKEPPKLNLCRPLSKLNLNRPNSSQNIRKLNIAQRPTSVFDEVLRQSNNRPSNSADSPSSSHNIKKSSTANSKQTEFKNPRNARPFTSDSVQSSFNSGSPDSWPSSSDSTRPCSSSSRPGSSDSRPSQSSARLDSSNGLISSDPQSFPSNFAYNTRSGSFNDRLGLVFVTSMPSQSNSEGSSNSKNGSSNTKNGSSNTRNGSSNTRNGSSNTSQGSSNTSQGSSNTSQSSSNTSQGSSNTGSSSSNSRPSNFDIAGNSRVPSSNNIRNVTKNAGKSQGSSNIGGGALPSNIGSQDAASSVVRAGGVKKRTNDQPQINMDTAATKTVDKDLGVSRGAVKKRLAPPPPRTRRDQPYYSALQRQQREERERQEQNQYNLAHGLPPVLNPLQKIEKLRKLDALQNRDYEEEYRARQARPSEPPQPRDLDDATRQEFQKLKPMSPGEFMERFNSLSVEPRADRFPEIKSSLRELRRGLNEVTAPYNVNNNIAANNNNDRVRTPSPQPPAEERLPCEFCGLLVPPQHLVQHQTGCRPDLARLVPEAAALPPLPLPLPPPPPPARGASSPADPIIPCEFCARPLPVYLIIEHQEQCIQENMPV